MVNHFATGDGGFPLCNVVTFFSRHFLLSFIDGKLSNPASQDALVTSISFF
jgi:hypothetical protein